VRATFAAFHMIEADTTYTVGAGAAVKAAELIISNFDPR
jgi:DNA adenine methylase